MPHDIARSTRALPLQIVMGALFCLLVLSVGLTIGLFGFRESRAMLLSASQEVFSRADRQMHLSVDNLFQPLQAAIEQLSYHPAANQADWRQRLGAVSAMADILERSNSVASVYIGYASGDFMMLRPLRTDAARLRWQAPMHARYSLEQIERQPTGTHYQRLYFDAARRRIAQRNVDDPPLDPRTRPWFKQAIDSTRVTATEPYIFFSTREPGITLARQSGAGSVVAADLTLQRLANDLADIHISPSAQKALLDHAGQVIVSSATGSHVAQPQQERMLRQLMPRQLRQAGIFHIHAGGTDWLGQVTNIEFGGRSLRLLLAAPRHELLQDAARLRDQQLWLTLLILCASMPLAWQASRWVSRPLARLAEEAKAIEAFDFSSPITHRSIIKEVDRLSVTMDGMKSTIAHFLDLSSALSSERRLDQLLQRILQETAAALSPNDAAVYLREDDGSLVKAADMVRGATLPDRLAVDGGELAQLCHQAATQQQQQCLDSSDFDQHLVAIPLTTPKGGSVGVMLLLFSYAVTPGKAAMAFATSLSGTAAISIDVQRLLESQKRLLEAFIQLIAGAIDAKSPYTGGHCQRVPVLTEMLADAACATQNGPLRDFNLDADEREALRLAAWLHDCGKITTPEYVVDKATKLETLNDRIHEIRTRFEVLKRDAEIEYWKALAAGNDPASESAILRQKLATLDDEFYFVASCNEGGESMSDAQLGRLQSIAARTWQRTLDDCAGVSHEERQRRQAQPHRELPATENLLADKPEHLIARPQQEQISRDNPWGFLLEVPQYKYNRGELYNLSVRRGTLTAEERYQINDHIVQSIIMLSRLPFPPALRQVPELAGGHHEKMDGTGYPKRLRREQMSIQARMMAIADIFEALTAIDRPYKRGKTLSEALEIMARMRDQHHIDADLFELFLRSGVHERYGERFLQPDQLDRPDVARFLRPT